MQKRASYANYEIFPQTYPTIENSTVYCDDHPVCLPTSPTSSLHYHNRMEIGLCCEGTGIFYSTHFSECINKGDIVIFLPGIPHFSHALSPSEPCLCRFAYIDVVPSLFGVFKENTSAIQLFSSAQGYDIPYIIRKQEASLAYTILSTLLTDAFDKTQHTEFFTGLHLTEFFLKAPTLFNVKENVSAASNVLSHDVMQVVESFISAHYNEPLNIQQLCELCHLSESQLRRSFKKIFGTPPMAYLHRLRCNIGAQLLLRTNLSINTISQKLGYLDASEFYKHFHSHFHCSPSGYRNQ